MPGYIAAADLITRISSKTAANLTTETGTTPDSALINTVIDESERIVDAAVAARTSTTITADGHPATFELLGAQTMAIAIFKLAIRRPPVHEDWKFDYEKTLDWLRDLAAGNVDLPDLQELTAPEDSSAWGGETKQDRIW